MQAHFLRYRYAPHWHEAICVAVVGAGAAAFDCGGVTHVAPAGSVFVIPPYEVHTGEPAAQVGLGYHVLYIRPERLADLLDDARVADPSAVPWPRDVVHPRAAAAGPLRRFHQAIIGPAWQLEREDALLSAVKAVAAEFRLGSPRPRRDGVREHRAVRLARDYLHAHPADQVTLRDLTRLTGLSMHHLARTFKAETGVAPHAYQVQLRVLQAKRLLAAGKAIAETAAECGFYDQAHLTAQFKRHVGVTPGTYARGMTALPASGSET